MQVGSCERFLGHNRASRARTEVLDQSEQVPNNQPGHLGFGEHALSDSSVSPVRRQDDDALGFSECHEMLFSTRAALFSTSSGTPRRTP